MSEQPQGIKYLSLMVQGRIQMPLLLVGIEGVGKRFSVIQAVKEDFSKGDPNSPAIFQLDKGVHPDFLLVESEGGKDIGIDTIRNVMLKALDMPMMASRRYIVIDGADKLTPAAANCFLKTLEEPPSTTQFVLLADSERKILPTIRSRCGLVRYHSLSADFIVSLLRDIEPDPVRGLLYARLSDGSVGRALYYAASGRMKLRDVAVDLLTVGVTGDLSRLFTIVDDAKEDLPLCIRFMHHVIYDLVMLPHDTTRLANVDIVDDLAVLSAKIGPSRLKRLQAGIKGVALFGDAKINLHFHVKSVLASVFKN